MTLFNLVFLALVFGALGYFGYLALRRRFPTLFTPRGPSVVAATAAAPPAAPEGKPATVPAPGTVI